MVRLLYVAIATLGCQGEQVSATPSDSGSDAGACAVTGNLVPNGDFALGAASWTTSGFGVEKVEGPCNGAAMRLKSTSDYADFGTAVATAPTKKGTRFRLRAWVRYSGERNPPWVGARFSRPGDGGEILETISANALGGGKWELVQNVGSLEHDATGVSIIIGSRNTGGDDFEVAQVSLVTE